MKRRDGDAAGLALETIPHQVRGADLGEGGAGRGKLTGSDSGDPGGGAHAEQDSVERGAHLAKIVHNEYPYACVEELIEDIGIRGRFSAQVLSNVRQFRLKVLCQRFDPRQVVGLVFNAHFDRKA